MRTDSAYQKAILYALNLKLPHLFAGIEGAVDHRAKRRAKRQVVRKSRRSNR